MTRGPPRDSSISPKEESARSFSVKPERNGVERVEELGPEFQRESFCESRHL
jgi:hypothetical protein